MHVPIYSLKLPQPQIAMQCKYEKSTINSSFRCKNVCKKVPTKKCVRKKNLACGESGYRNCHLVNKEICKEVPVSVDKRIKKTYCEMKPDCHREKRRLCPHNKDVKCPDLNQQICTLVKENECHHKPKCKLGQCKRIEYERCKVKMPGCKEKICDHHHSHKEGKCRLIEEEICSDPICEEKPVRKCKPCPKTCNKSNTPNNNKCQSRCFNVYSCPICLANNKGMYFVNTF